MEVLIKKESNRYSYYIKPSKYRAYVKFYSDSSKIKHGLNEPKNSIKINSEHLTDWILIEDKGNYEEKTEKAKSALNKIAFIKDIYMAGAV